MQRRLSPIRSMIKISGEEFYLAILVSNDYRIFLFVTEIKLDRFTYVFHRLLIPCSFAGLSVHDISNAKKFVTSWKGNRISVDNSAAERDSFLHQYDRDSWSWWMINIRHSARLSLYLIHFTPPVDQEMQICQWYDTDRFLHHLYCPENVSFLRKKSVTQRLSCRVERRLTTKCIIYSWNRNNRPRNAAIFLLIRMIIPVMKKRGWTIRRYNSGNQPCAPDSRRSF